MTHHTFASGK